MSYSTLQLTNGVTLAYEVLGSSHLGYRRPIVLVSGLSIVRKDWSLLSNCLAQKRPVLVYDHRGIGDSVCGPSNVEDISVETMALDLLALLTHLQWQEFAICGWSMGGVVAQQLLCLPFHPIHPIALPFNVPHVFLVGTRSVVLQSGQHGFSKNPPANLTPEDRMKLIRSVLANTFDPAWLQRNQAQFDNLFRGWITGVRPYKTIGMAQFTSAVDRSLRSLGQSAKQQQAGASFNFQRFLTQIPRETKILVIHGELDRIIPYQAGRDIPSYIPSARFMSVGDAPGQVRSSIFGHFWFQYFDIDMWRDVLEYHLLS